MTAPVKIAIRDGSQEPMVVHLSGRDRPYVGAVAAHVLADERNDRALGDGHAQEELAGTIACTLKSCLNGGSGLPNKPNADVIHID